MPDSHCAMKSVRGILLRDEGDRLIVQASDEDVKAFASPGLAVTVATDEPPPAGLNWFLDQHLYDRYGRPVARITRVSGRFRLTGSSYDITTHNDVGWMSQHGDRIRTVIEAEGLGQSMTHIVR